MERMNREQFYAKLGPLSREELQKALWTLYGRGTAAMRERIAAEIASAETMPVKQRSAATVDPPAVLAEVRQFAELARAGSYLAGDRRVRPKERTQWRFTFKRLLSQSRDALRSDDFGAAGAAMEMLLDLANDTRRYQYFRSKDAVESAGIVVSDEAALLWARMLERDGLAGFCTTATTQLIRWESRYGWTLRGFGKVAEKEIPLARVLAGMLPVPDAWTVVADSYLDALDRCAPVKVAKPRSPWRMDGYEARERADSLALWHELLFDRFAGGDEEDRLDRLTTHPALDGPELVYLQARLAHQRAQVNRARELMRECLDILPGHRGFLTFAEEIGASVPAESRRAAQRAM